MMKFAIKHRVSNDIIFTADIVADDAMSFPMRLGLAVIVAVKAGVDLSGADLRGAHLSGADLRDARLNDVDLRDADLSNANLSRANLAAANLSGANLSFMPSAPISAAKIQH